MARKTSADKAMAKVFEFLKESGIDTSQMAFPDKPSYDYGHSDAPVVFAHTPNHFIPGICKECGKPFAHNRPIKAGTAVGFCSDPCRKDNWKKTTGLDYNAISTKDVWDGKVPLVITAEQFSVLQEIAEWFTKHQAILQSNQVLPPESSSIQEEEEYSTPLVEETSQDLGDSQTNLHAEPVSSIPQQTEDDTDLDSFFATL